MDLLEAAGLSRGILGIVPATMGTALPQLRKPIPELRPRAKVSDSGSPEGTPSCLLDSERDLIE